jgi:hypothetical protein
MRLLYLYSAAVRAQTSAELCSVWPGAQARCTTQLSQVTFKEQDHSVSKLMCAGTVAIPKHIGHAFQVHCQHVAESCAQASTAVRYYPHHFVVLSASLYIQSCHAIWSCFVVNINCSMRAIIDKYTLREGGLGAAAEQH